MTSINNNMLLGQNSSISNIRNNFNALVQGLADTSLNNLMKNALIKDAYDGDAAPSWWTLSTGVTVDTTQPLSVVSMPSNGSSIYQYIDHYLAPNTNYLLTFEVEPSHNCTVGIINSGGISNLATDGSSFVRNITSTDCNKQYFTFETSESFTNLQFKITNEYAGVNLIAIKNIKLVKGSVELFDAVESNFFLDSLKYGVHPDSGGIHVWQFTNNGDDWYIMPTDLSLYLSKADFDPSLYETKADLATTLNAYMTTDVGRRLSHYYGRR